MANDVGHGGIVSGFLEIVRDGQWPGLEAPTPYELFTKQGQDATNTLLDAIRCQPRAGPTWRALRLLVDRMMRSAENIHRLFDISRHDAAMDGASILRTLYDAHLQALYILKEPVERGKLYVDFLWVEIREMVRIIGENTTHLGQMVRSNMQAAQVEQAAKAEFDAVKANYPRGEGGHCTLRCTATVNGSRPRRAAGFAEHPTRRLASRQQSKPSHQTESSFR